MSKLVVWSAKSPVVVAVFADYLERHGCQVISVVPPQDTSCLTRIYARAPEDFDSGIERIEASSIVFAPDMLSEKLDIHAGEREDYSLETYLDLARRGDS